MVKVFEVWYSGKRLQVPGDYGNDYSRFVLCDDCKLSATVQTRKEAAILCRLLMNDPSVSLVFIKETERN